MTASDLCYMPASKLLKLFKNGELSPVTLMEATIERAQTTEPHINAFSDTYFDEAMAGAKKAEQAYASGTASGLLEGLPVALKNEPHYAGKKIDMGSSIFKDTICSENHPVTDRILSAGGLIHAATNVPEFCAAHFTRTNLYGSTATPWNTKINSGGSSGGSGASLAAGSCSLAVGTDIAGSIRIPSSYCGVVGLKPSYGRVPEVAPFNLESYNHVGPMARTVADCALFLNAIAGPHPRDIVSLRPKMELPLSYGDIKGMKIAYSSNLDFINVEPEIEKAMQEAVRTLRDLGATVEEVSLGCGNWVKEAYHKRLSFMFASWIKGYYEQHKDIMNDYNIYYAEHTKPLTADDHLAALGAEQRMYDTLGPLLDRYDALICPTAATNGVPREATTDHLLDLYEVLLTYPFNMVSRCPVLSIPAGFCSNNVPVGMQVVGRTYDEPTIFKVAYNYEQATQWTYNNRPNI